ncbi:hypothetical protein SDC9_166753 [bioreactor metagenome]|uniref:EpsI family protein n=2 Tax=root TaxID=1 RepID=A0A323UNA5_9RHOO|nr:exosortase-associated protein EpsI, B-type [Parazoarcus communis]NMG72267.1 EpsI family protein [Parazoarcus communis SWub3 = DSM 12120]PZA14482.1 EpsI family protein [Azoarcus communis] [Parazoarcus communis SWub3 = DSM 12120]
MSAETNGYRGRLVQALLASALMIISVFVTAAVTPTARLSDVLGTVNLEGSIPKEFGKWKVDEQENAGIVNPQQQALLDQLYSQILSRTYVDENGRRVMLSIAYGEDQRDSMQAHKPEVCYPAQGFLLLSLKNDVLAFDKGSVPVKRLETALAERRYEPVTYWHVVAGEVPTSGIEKKMVEMRYGFNGVIPDGLLFRVSTVDRDSKQGFSIQDEFLRELLSSLSDKDRKRLAGF